MKAKPKKKAAKKAATKSAKPKAKPKAKPPAKKQAKQTKKDYKVLFYNTLLTKTKVMKLSGPKIGDVLYYGKMRGVVVSINGHSIGALLDPTEDKQGRVIL